jgi:hypothetical protein
MWRINRASASSGFTLVVLFLAYMLTQDAGSIEFSFDFLASLVLIAISLWFLGTAFAFVALLPLKRIADRTSYWFSLPLFLVVGFIVPAWLQYEIQPFLSHGEAPTYDADVWRGIFIMGLMGVGCAAVSWLSIRKSKSIDSA